MKSRLAFGLLIVSLPLLTHSAEPTVAAAASRHYPAIKWQGLSAVVGDFSCRGRKEYAILGTGKQGIAVAVFLNGLERPPAILRYSSQNRDPHSATLTTEKMDLDLEELEKEAGYVPQGLRPSKTCLGLNLSDGKVDSAHIYWNHDANRFNDWSL